MKYISTAEAASRWGIGIRQVQRLLQEGKINGARRYGRQWMIPEDADRDRHYRFYGGFPVFRKYRESIPGDTDEERHHCEALYAHLRGDYETGMKCYENGREESPYRFNDAYLSCMSAIASGNYDLFVPMEAILRKMDHTGVIEDLIQMAAYGMGNTPAFVKNEDFDAFPEGLRTMLVFHHMKYLQTEQRYAEMTAVGKTLLAVTHDEQMISEWDIYVYILTAAGCLALGRSEEAETLLNAILAICEPYGFVTPFAEHYVMLGGVLEKCAEVKYPQFYKKTVRLADTVWNNWVRLHNHICRDHLSIILTPDEYRTAVSLSHGSTYREIADSQHVSIHTVKSHISTIYEKLYIHSRSELSYFLMDL